MLSIYIYNLYVCLYSLYDHRQSSDVIFILYYMANTLKYTRNDDILYIQFEPKTYIHDYFFFYLSSKCNT